MSDPELPKLFIDFQIFKLQVLSLHTTGHEDSSKGHMEDVCDPAGSLQLCELAINTVVLNPLVDFTPGHNTLVDMFLGPAEGPNPPSIPKEYFKVASAFAALGAVMKDSEQDKMLNPSHQRLGLQVMLKGAMEQLQVLAQNAQGSDKKVMEQAEAMVKDNEAWEAERSNLLEKVAASETQSLRMERESIKDTEADAKAVGTVSNHEQGWKNERVKLQTEIHGLQDEIAKIWHHSEIRATDSGSFCEDCIVKGSLLKELAAKLSTAEIDASELRKKLATVISNSMKHLAAVADATAKYEEMENKLVNATKEMEVMQRDLESAASAKRSQNTIIEELLSDVMTIQKDLIEKEEILAVTLTRASLDREEKHNLEKELVYAKRKMKAVEVEKDRWKRLAEERHRASSSRKDTDNRLRGMVKSKQEVAKRSELQRMHTQELQSVQSLYTEKLKALEHQLKTYENKVGLLESKVLVCSRQRQVGRHLLKEDEVPDMLNLKQTVNVHELVMLLESLEPDVSTIRTDGQTSEIQGVDLLANSLVMQFLFWNMATLFPLLRTPLCFRSQVEGP